MKTAKNLPAFCTEIKFWNLHQRKWMYYSHIK